MIRYSRPNPDGTYEYFEVPGMLAIGNDLPVPVLSAASELGVPSIEAGRPVPANARHVGRGRRAMGLIAPMDDSMVTELGADGGTCPPQGSLLVGVILFGAGFATYWLVDWLRKRA